MRLPCSQFCALQLDGDTRLCIYYRIRGLRESYLDHVIFFWEHLRCSVYVFMRQKAPYSNFFVVNPCSFCLHYTTLLNMHKFMLYAVQFVQCMHCGYRLILFPKKNYTLAAWRACKSFSTWIYNSSLPPSPTTAVECLWIILFVLSQIPVKRYLWFY